MSLTKVTNRVVDSNLIGNQAATTSLISTDELLIRRPSENTLQKVNWSTALSSVQTILPAPGIAKAWGCFSWNGRSSTLTIHDTYNVQSISVATPFTSNPGIYAYIINFSNPMPNRNYAVVTGNAIRGEYTYPDLVVSSATYPYEESNIDVPSTSIANFTPSYNSGKSTTQLKMAIYYRDGGIAVQRSLQLIEGYFAIYAD